MSLNQVIVVGAGVCGVSVALDLQRRGRDVTIIDDCDAGRGCSFGNAGVITPSIFPPAATYPLATIPRLLANPASPLSVSWRSFWTLFPWARDYLYAAKQRIVEERAAWMHRLARHAIARYRDLLSDELPFFTQKGFLSLHLTESELFKARRSVAKRALHGVGSRIVLADELADMEPSLIGVGAGATLIESCGHISNPGRFVSWLFDRFVSLGGKFVRDKVVSVHPGHDGHPRVECSERKFSGRPVVLAAGARTNSLLPSLGQRIPIVSERGYHIDLDLAPNTIRRPIALSSLGLVLTPTDTGVRLAGLAHFGTPGHSARPQLMLKAMRRVQEHFEWVRPLPNAAVWSGERPSTPDGLPIVEEVPQCRSLYVCAGHGHAGLTLAAVTARIAGDLVCGLENADGALVSSRRFGSKRY